MRLRPAAKKATSIPRRRTWETINGRRWSQTTAHGDGEGQEQGRGEGVLQHVDRGRDAGVAGRLRFEPRPAPPENDGEEHQEAGEHQDSLAVAPDDVLQRVGMVVKGLDDL